MTSVRTRILFFFTLFASMALLAVYTSTRSTQSIGDAATNIVSHHMPMAHAVDEMELALLRQDTTVYRYLVTNDRVWLDEYERARADYARWFAESQKRATETDEADKLAEVDELYVPYDNETRQIVLAKSADHTKMLKVGDQYLMKIQMRINQLKGIREGMTTVRQEQIADTLRWHRRVALIFPMMIVVFFLGLAFYLWRFLVQPLDLLLDGIRNFTRGKTDVRIPRIGKDELGELQEAFNEMSRELELERKRLRTESQSDALTGLFNMRYFRSQLIEEFSRSQRYSRPVTLLMIDVDHFKNYNDRNGHPAGDIVLKEISRILVRNVRGTDTVARYGGEEFVVMLPETPADSGESVAEKIRKAVEEHHFPFAGKEVGSNPTVSVGVASFPHPQISGDQDLIEASDKALYAAKHAGRNRVSVFGKLDANALNVISTTKSSAQS